MHRRDGGGSTETRNWLGPFQGGHRSDRSGRNSGSRQKNINCGGSGGRDTIVEGRKLHCPGLGEQGSLQEPLAWERERPRQGSSCSPLRFRSAGADVLQPRPIPRLEPKLPWISSRVNHGVAYGMVGGAGTE